MNNIIILSNRARARAHSSDSVHCCNNNNNTRFHHYYHYYCYRERCSIDPPPAGSKHGRTRVASDDRDRTAVEPDGPGARQSEEWPSPRLPR